MAPPDCLELCCVEMGDTIFEALQAINEGNIEITFVLDTEKRVIGTLTDGDLRRALLGGAALQSPLAPFVRRQFIAVSPEISRAEVIDIMLSRRISQIPVLNTEGRLVGIHCLHETIGGEERPNWAVILAGGRGERLRPFTDSIPKPMLKVAGRPILERLILHIAGFGIRKIFLSINYLGEMIERYFQDGSQFGCEIHYLKEKKPLGTGGSLSLLPEIPQAPLLVLNGDLLTQVNIRDLLNFHSNGRYAATVAVHEYSHTIPFGVVDVNDDAISGLQEKPTMVWLANAGIYLLNPSLLQTIPKDCEFPLPALIERCVANREAVGAFRMTSEWTDIGRPAELRRANGDTEKR
jgi:dTDP-glucose pyrophosphorylase